MNGLDSLDINGLIEVNFPRNPKTIIKVVGVGGGGGNAVKKMFNDGIEGISYALCNTDKQVLDSSLISTKLQIGKKITDGDGAGNKPETAKQAALESEQEINVMFNDGTKMVFVVAGMGGGTGTGAAPVVARIAKEKGLLTVGIVTIPFVFEKKKKIIQALKGVMEISKNVDALLVINNEKLRSQCPDASIKEAFAKVDETISIAAQGIFELITNEGVMNVDLADVRTTLQDSGVAIMTTGVGDGENRLEQAIENAMNSHLINNNNVLSAKRVLFAIYTHSNHSLKVSEMEYIDIFTESFKDVDIDVIYGLYDDDSLDTKAKITLLASGFGMESLNNIAQNPSLKMTEEEIMELEAQREAQELEQQKMQAEIENQYGLEIAKRLNNGKKYFKPKPYILSNEDLNDDKIIEAIENIPAYKRDGSFNPRENSANLKENSKGDLFDI